MNQSLHIPSVNIDTVRFRRPDHLPYQTTSQQAMETLAGGVGLGAPRRAPLPPQMQTPSKSIKKRKSNRFNFCACGSNIDMYDEGLNTSFVASSRPGEKFIGRIRAASFTQKVLPPMPPSMPSVEYCPKPSIEAFSRERRSSKAGESIPHNLPQQPLEQPESPCQIQMSSSYEDINSTTSCSPQAQVMTAIRANMSETTLAREHNDFYVPAHKVALRQRNKQIVMSEPFDSSQDAFYPLIRPKSSTALLCSQLDGQDEEVSAIKQRHRRRGGFIATSTPAILSVKVADSPTILLAETNDHLHDAYADAEEEEEAIIECYTDATAPPQTLSRMSAASTMSKYSVMSPYVDTHSIPSRATMGGAEGDTPMQRYHHFDSPLNLSGSRISSTAGSICRTKSINSTTSSLKSSEHSPAIGEVLAHFPSLANLNRADFHSCTNSSSSPYPSSDPDGEEEFGSNRVNTFGATRRKIHDYQEDHSIGRINSFHYDDDNEVIALHCQRFQSSDPGDSPVSSLSSTDSSCTDSTTRSRRSEKRSAVLRGKGLPSHADLAALGCSEAGDLTWEEKILSLTRGSSSDPANDDDDDDDEEEAEEEDANRTISLRLSTSKETLRSHRTSVNTRSRGSATSQIGPFSPPPNLPLPPIPFQRKSSTRLRSAQSVMPIEIPQIPQHPSSSYHHRPIISNLPRSITCPELSESGYAF